MKNTSSHEDLDLIQDSSLKERLLEDLEDHLDDLRAAGKSVDRPWDQLGDPLSLARQVNTIYQPWLKHIFFGIFSCLISLFLFYLSFLALTFLDTPLQQNTSVFVLEILGKMMSLGLIATFLFALTLSITRWYLSFFGKSFRGMVFVRGVAYLPLFLVFILEVLRFISLAVAPSLSDEVSNLIISGFISTLLGFILNFFIIIFAQKVAFRYALRVQKWHKKVLNYVPYLLAALMTIGLVSLSIDSLSEEMLLFLVFSMILVLICYLLLWGFTSAALGHLFVTLQIPAIYGFVVVTTIPFALLLMILCRRFFKKPFIYFERLLLALLLPAFLIVPFKKHDIPPINWNAPLVWSWEDLEKQQLSFTYPWSASLMRSNDGQNVSYQAEAQSESIEVTQQGGFSYLVDRDGIKMMEFKGFDEYSHNYESKREDFPAEFTCEKRITDVEQVTILTDDLFQQNGPFGIDCAVLFYKDFEIATIGKGNLVGLELTRDGLLAVVINMGSYDPDYVYIVDIANLSTD